MSEEEGYKPYLIQRLIYAPATAEETKRKGIDRYFRYDYMGSTEFEFGALPKAVKLVRSFIDQPSEWIPKKLVHQLHNFWYIGSPDYEGIAKVLISDQMLTFSYRKIHLKESSFIRESTVEQKSYTREIHGWWDLNAPYAFFTKKDYAQAWLKGLRSK